MSDAEAPGPWLMPTTISVHGHSGSARVLCRKLNVGDVVDILGEPLLVRAVEIEFSTVERDPFGADVWLDRPEGVHQRVHTLRDARRVKTPFHGTCGQCGKREVWCVALGDEGWDICAECLATAADAIDAAEFRALGGKP